MNLILGMFTALFSVVNPLGAIPMFLSLTQNYSIEHRNHQALKASIYMMVILVTFMLLGTYILAFFGITIEGMKIAGGLIIIRSGYNLMDVNYKRGKAISKAVEQEAVAKEDISFSPLAMPMLSGPGSISLLLSKTAGMGGYLQYAYLVAAIALLGIVTYIILRFSPRMFSLLGQGGIAAMSRIMGFIVITIGIQYIISGTVPILQSIMHK